MKVKISKDLQLPQIPGAVYKVVLETGNYQLTKSQQTGNDLLKCKFTIRSQGPTEVNTIGRKLPADNFTFTEDSIWKLDQMYAAATGEHLPEGEMELEDLINMVMTRVQGKELLARVELRVYKGSPRPSIAEYQQIQG